MVTRSAVAASDAWVISTNSFPLPPIFAVIVAAVALFASASWLSFLRRRYSLPPGPSPWPILGNLPDLGFLPYRSLAKLADRFGLVLTVWIGSIPSVIITSSELAREVLKTHDKFCSSRPLLRLIEFASHGGKDIFFSPSNDHWRKLRRMAKLHLLSSRGLQETLWVREAEICDMLDAIARVANNGDPRGVQMRGYLNRGTLNNILRLTVGKSYTYSTVDRAAAAAPGEMLEAAIKTDWQGRIAAINGAKSGELASIAEDEMEGEKVIAMVDETFQVMGTFNLADFIPWLSPLDPQRIYARAKRLNPHFEGYVLACIAERKRMLETRRGRAGERGVEERNKGEKDVGLERWHKNDGEGGKGEGGDVKLGGEESVAERVLVDALLEIESQGEEQVTGKDRVTREEIMLLCLDLINAGTDTTAKTVEWALAELASHPAMLERLQAEVDAAYSKSAAGSATEVSAEEEAAGECNVKQHNAKSSLPVQEMPYLQAVIKETLRHHPPVPLLIPHMTTASVSIGGYTIPPDTIIQINAWGLAHDPTVWIDPHNFDPSRFLGPLAPDVTGQDYGVLPFGSGRRVCAGMNLGLDLSARMLASIVSRFDFKLPEDVLAAGGVDLGEDFSLTLALAKPLRLVLRERKGTQLK